MTTKDG